MKSAILIPTYGPHIPFNTRFIDSVLRFNAVDDLPSIVFTTSDEAERDQLNAHVATLGPGVAKKIWAESLAAPLARVDLSALSDPDGALATGRIGFIVYKKFCGLKLLFDQGFDTVLLLDSEVIQFRPYSLRKFVEDESRRNEYRSSVAGTGDGQVQRDSCRSIDPNYDPEHPFARGYGWFDNLCFFDRDLFIRFLSDVVGDVPDQILALAHHLRGLAFDWVVYRAWMEFRTDLKINRLDLDAVIRSQGREPIPSPQTEWIYAYMTGKVRTDAKFLAAINPPWLPFTLHARTLRAIDRALPKSCCLMFHVDRDHVGARPMTPLLTRVRGKLRRMFGRPARA